MVGNTPCFHQRPFYPAVSAASGRSWRVQSRRKDRPPAHGRTGDGPGRDLVPGGSIIESNSGTLGLVWRCRHGLPAVTIGPGQWSLVLTAWDPSRCSARRNSDQQAVGTGRFRPRTHTWHPDQYSNLDLSGGRLVMEPTPAGRADVGLFRRNHRGGVSGVQLRTEARRRGGSNGQPAGPRLRLSLPDNGTTPLSTSVPDLVWGHRLITTSNCRNRLLSAAHCLYCLTGRTSALRPRGDLPYGRWWGPVSDGRAEEKR